MSYHDQCIGCNLFFKRNGDCTGIMRSSECLDCHDPVKEPPRVAVDVFHDYEYQLNPEEMEL